MNMEEEKQCKKVKKGALAPFYYLVIKKIW